MGPLATDQGKRCQANTELKFKLVNAATKSLRRTLLGPVFDAPVRHLCPLPASKYNQDLTLLAFAAGDKVFACFVSFIAVPCGRGKGGAVRWLRARAVAWAGVLCRPPHPRP